MVEKYYFEDCGHEKLLKNLIQHINYQVVK